jgi:hypothetical protein
MDRQEQFVQWFDWVTTKWDLDSDTAARAAGAALLAVERGATADSASLVAYDAAFGTNVAGGTAAAYRGGKASSGASGWKVVAILAGVFAALTVGVVLAIYISPFVLAGGLLIALLVLWNPGQVGNSIHDWKLWKRLPVVRSQKSAGGFALAVLLYTVPVPGLFTAMDIAAATSPAPSTQVAGTGGGRQTSLATPRSENSSAPTTTAAPSPTPPAEPSPSASTAPAAAPPAVQPVPTPKKSAAPVPPTATDPYAAQKAQDPALRAQGISAICADGTYSSSASRSGTCSHHGGVHWWTGLVGAEGPGTH